MTIDEAIKLLQGLVLGDPLRDYARACKLGIEALKRCKRARENGTFVPVYPLEGESLN
jgi:hypothetical protein